MKHMPLRIPGKYGVPKVGGTEYRVLGVQQVSNLRANPRLTLSPRSRLTSSPQSFSILDYLFSSS